MGAAAVACEEAAAEKLSGCEMFCGAGGSLVSALLRGREGVADGGAKGGCGLGVSVRYLRVLEDFESFCMFKL